MICKINQGMSFSGLIDYITNELKDGHVIASQGVCTANKRAILDSFAIQCSMGATRTQYPVGHFALSWHKDERPRMTDEFMAQLTREFMDELGYGQTQYVVTVHNDTQHPHCHIAYNRVGNDGKALNNSFLKRRAIKACRVLEQRHNLHSAVRSKLDNVDPSKLRGKDRSKFAMKKTVLTIAQRSQSWRQFEAELAKAGITMSFRYGADSGIKGVIFSDVTLNIGGKSLHADLSLTSLDRRFGGELSRRNYCIALPNAAVVPVVKRDGQKRKSVSTHSTTPLANTAAIGGDEQQPMPSNAQADTSLASDVFDMANGVAEDIIISARQTLCFITAPLAFVETPSISMGGGGSTDNDLDRKKKKEDDRPQTQPNTTYHRRRRR